MLAIEPDAAQERFQRALLKLQDDDMVGARQDIDWLLKNRPSGLDYGRLEEFRGTLAGGECFLTLCLFAFEAGIDSLNKFKPEGLDVRSLRLSQHNSNHVSLEVDPAVGAGGTRVSDR